MNTVFKIFSARNVFNARKFYSFQQIKNFVKPPSKYTSVLLAGAAVEASTNNNEPKIVDYKTFIKEACLNNDSNIKMLIETLQTAILETSEKYRNFLKKQIVLLENTTKMSPVEENWDALIQYRAQAETLKEELDLYRGLVEYVGHLSYNLDLCAVMIGNFDEAQYVCQDYAKLEKMTNQQTVENRRCEAKLLQMNAKHIVDTQVPK